MAGDCPLFGGKLVLDHLGDVSFQISVRNVCDFGVSLINLLNDVASDVDLSSDHSLDFRMRVVAGLGPDVDFVFAFFDDHSNTDEVSVCYGPDSLVLLIVDLENIFLFIQHFHLNNLTVHLGEGLFFLQKLNNLINGVLGHRNTFGCNPLVNGKFKHGTWFVSTLLPVRRILKFFQPHKDVF